MQPGGLSPPASFHTASGHSDSTNEAFVFSKKPAKPLNHLVPSQPRLQDALDPPAFQFSHRRELSNPFDVLYDAKPPTTPHVAASPRPQQFMKKHQRIISDVPPIITLIDQQALSRSSSVISRSASLRNRHNITKRNKMVNRKALDFDSDSIYNSDRRSKSSPSTIRRKIRFLFPVSRKTSLKKTPSYRLLKDFKPKGNFSSRHELENFLGSCDAYNLVREMLPATMKVYNYANLISCDPKLSAQTHEFDISKDNQFTVIKREPPTALKISAPIKETFTKNGYNENQLRYEKHKFNLLDSIYNRYRAEVFGKKYVIPPKFSDVFPEEAGRNLLTAKEIDGLNKKILLEVLLRRTLAAKIEYRLKTSGWKPKSATSNASNASNSSSNDENDHYRHSHIPKLVHTDSDSNSDNDSVNTDDIMQHNASLYSGLLPSPQISYKSNIFGSGFKFDASDFYVSDDVNAKHLIKHPRSDVSGTKKSSEAEFVNAFSRELSEHKHDQPNTDRGLLRTGLDYELKPMNRSTETFSSLSSDDDTRTPPLGRSQHNSLISQKIESHNTKSTSIVSGHKRSTSSNASILKDLEDLSSRLSIYLNDDEQLHEPRPQFMHKNTIPSESDLIGVLPKSMAQEPNCAERLTQHPVLTTAANTTDSVKGHSVEPTGPGPKTPRRASSQSRLLSSHPIANAFLSGRSLHLDTRSL